MIVLDENAVAEGAAVVRSAAEGDGPFLNGPPARQRFSSIENRHRKVMHSFTEPVRERGDSREMLEEVERDPFCLEYRSPIAVDPEERVSTSYASAVMPEDGKLQAGINGYERLDCGRHSGDDQRLLGDDACTGWDRSLE